jgi:hypothetical protein
VVNAGDSITLMPVTPAGATMFTTADGIIFSIADGDSGDVAQPESQNKPPTTGSITSRRCLIIKIIK